MRYTLTRIADLETKLTPKEAGRVYAVCGGPVDGNPAEFIRACGLPIEEDRDVILQHILMAPSPDGPRHVELPLGLGGQASNWSHDMTDRKSRIRKVEQCSVVKHGKPLAKIEPGP